MLPDDDEPETLIATKVMEAALVLPFPTEVKIDYLPAVIPVPVAEAEATSVPLAEPLDLLGSLDDLVVPPEVEQTLIYHWLRDGPPEWRGSIVAQAPPEEARVVVPLFRPDLPPGPRRRHDAGDGLARVIRYRE